MKASDCGWKYKSGERVQLGDHVLISKHWAKHHDVKREAIVTGLQGFVRVELSNDSDIDLDMRSLTFCCRKGQTLSNNAVEPRNVKQAVESWLNTMMGLHPIKIQLEEIQVGPSGWEEVRWISGHYGAVGAGWFNNFITGWEITVIPYPKTASSLQSFSVNISYHHGNLSSGGSNGVGTTIVYDHQDDRIYTPNDLQEQLKNPEFLNRCRLEAEAIHGKQY